MAKRPELILKVFDKDSGTAHGKCGVGFINDDGSISVVLDAMTVLYGKGHPGYSNLVYTLFKNEAWDEKKHPPRKRQADTETGDDIPF